MNEGKRAKRLWVAAGIWLAILLVAAIAYRFVIQPFFSEKEVADTGSRSQYDANLRLAADSFSGYAVLRSPVLRDELKAHRIRLNVDDDGADYTARLKALKNGDADMAVFTIDSFIKAGAELGEFPASIVLVIDETRGADAMVAYKEGVASIQDLDDPNAGIVLTPDSPSEFLARVVLAQFSLPSLPGDWAKEEDGAERVFAEFRGARKNAKRAYVLWEPYVSRALGESGAHVLLDSSQLAGYIVDVLVANRSFLRDHPETVATFVESYLRALYSYSSRAGGMAELMTTDAKSTGSGRLTKEQAASLVDGIHWKNTQENYGHFGIAATGEAASLELLEDMILKITEVLETTGAVSANPIGARANTLFYDKILRDLQAADFHPSRKLNVLQGVEAPAAEEVARTVTLPALSDAQWERLVPVGELRIEPISFGRGGARLNVQSERDLEALAKRLKSFPTYYVMVVGHARAEGDPDANLRLASDRAEAAANALRAAGLQANRIRAKADAPSASNGDAQSVSFLVGQAPY